jgi:glycosyltransferase involved in cell wall biosynthesis
MWQSPLKIAMVTPQWLKTKGGPTTYVSNLVKELRLLGHEVCVLTNEAGDGVLQFHGRLFLRILYIYKHLKNLKPDIVHMHGRVSYIAPAWLYKIFCNNEVKLIITFHTMPSVRGFLHFVPHVQKAYAGFRGVIARFMLRRCDAVASVSHSIVADLNRYYNMGIHHYNVIHSASSKMNVDPNRVKSIKDRYALHFNKPVLCTVGVMNWDWKVAGQQICIEAVDLLRKQFPDIRLLIAGDGKFRTYLEEIVHQREMEDFITFLGNVDFIPELLASSDIYVHMALNEACPHSVIEAMRAEKPVIAANRGGIPEFVQNELTGLLIEPDAEELAHAVVRLVENKWEADKLANQANEYAKTNLNWETIAKQYLTLYQRINSA